MVTQARFFAIILLTTFACAQADTTSVQTVAAPKVMVVQLQEVAQNSKWFQAEQKKVENRMKPQIDAFQAMEKSFNEKLQKLQSGAKDMKPEMQQKLQEELASLKAQLEIKQRSLQSTIETEMRSAEEQLIKAVQAVCKRLGFDVVIPGALYVKDQFDATKQVVVELDKNVAATPAQTTAKKLENEVSSAAKRVEKAF